jgi:hypothetical protein
MLSNLERDTKVGLTIVTPPECNVEGGFLRVDSLLLAGGGTDAGALCSEIDSVYIKQNEKRLAYLACPL